VSGRANFGAALWAAAQPHPDRTFLIDDQRVWTYGEFFATVRRFAGALQAAGANPGDRVTVHVEKSPEAVALYVACLWAGTVHVPLNPRFTNVELEYYVNDADPRVVVTAEPTGPPPDQTRLMAERSRHWLTLQADGTGSFTELAKTARILDAPVERDDNDLAAILYTSGTTGKPKGAALSHRSLGQNAEALHQTWQFDEHDQLVHVLPIFHVHGLFVALHTAMLSAIPVRFHRSFDPERTITDFATSTVFMGVPTHYKRLSDSPALTPAACAPMRLFTSGSAPLSKTEFVRFSDRSGHQICERYGMSETGITLSNPYRGDRQPGTVGFPLAGVEAMIVDEAHREVERTTVGVVAIRSDQTMLEYWGRPDETAASFFGDRWFLTGDVGWMDAQGRVTLQGRASDMIISGGENVYPKEIEMVLDQIEGVVESAVIAIADQDLGEQVVAVLVCDGKPLTLTDLQPVLQENLARFKHPRQVFCVPELPRNAMGKVQKNQLRDRDQSVR